MQMPNTNTNIQFDCSPYLLNQFDYNCLPECDKYALSICWHIEISLLIEVYNILINNNN